MRLILQAAKNVCLAVAAIVASQHGVATAQGLSLRVGVTTGDVFIENGGNAGVNFDGYEITSASGSLSVPDWLSIADNYDLSGDQSVDTLADWFEISADSTSLAEGSLEAFSGQLASGQRVDLGAIWSTTGLADLMFEYLVGGEVFSVEPVYFLEADLNRDDLVTASDFVILRDSIGAGGRSADTNSDGVVDATDLLVFPEQFGAVNPIASPVSLAPSVLALSVAVPEPSSAALVMPAAMLMAWRGRRRPR